jgi:hypothetical protein
MILGTSGYHISGAQYYSLAVLATPASRYPANSHNTLPEAIFCSKQKMGVSLTLSYIKAF